MSTSDLEEAVAAFEQHLREDQEHLALLVAWLRADMAANPEAYTPEAIAERFAPLLGKDPAVIAADYRARLRAAGIER